MQEHDDHERLSEELRSAFERKSPINIVGGNSKSFYGRERVGSPLDVTTHTGIISYEPSELVITARCGTPLIEIENALAEQNQILPFEPPHFNQSATIGGTITCAFSGPRRPYAGAVRDNMLGLHLINGKGEYLKFGGEVMKNVAGYDVSRLNCGAQGTLGIITQASIKVLPAPKKEITLVFETPENQAIRTMTEWMAKPWPISATFYDGHKLYVRLSGVGTAIDSLHKTIGGDLVDPSAMLWNDLREHSLDFFHSEEPLWRVSLPVAAPVLSFATATIMEWNGALRWLHSEENPEHIYKEVASLGGHATQFRNGTSDQELFQPLTPGLQKLHKRIKQAFDPENILNPGRVYSWC